VVRVLCSAKCQQCQRRLAAHRIPSIFIRLNFEVSYNLSSFSAYLKFLDLDSDFHNLRTESLKQQYNLVKDRTSVHNTYSYGSHVMQYGSLNLNVQNLFSYIGTNPANDGNKFVEGNSLPSFTRAVNQRDADLVYFWQKVCIS
jgi:hypothetical protein